MCGLEGIRPDAPLKHPLTGDSRTVTGPVESRGPHRRETVGAGRSPVPATHRAGEQIRLRVQFDDDLIAAVVSDRIIRAVAPVLGLALCCIRFAASDRRVSCPAAGVRAEER